MTYTNYLELFNYILTHGEKQQGKTHFKSLTAWHEIDGYTCYLGYKDVTLTLLFHSRFSYDHGSKSNVSEFEKATLNLFTSIQK